MDSTVPAGARADRFIAGDPLRGLAAICVITVHVAYTLAFEGVGIVAILTAPGHRSVTALAVAVCVFFVLSGYLIARPFVRSYLDGTPLPAVRPYLVNRALRILPAYWVVLTGMLVIYGSLGSSPAGVAAIYGLQQELFSVEARGLLLQSWTVVVEAGFYVAVPLVAFALVLLVRPADRRRRVLVLLAALAVAWAASAVLRVSVPTRLGPFEQLQVSFPAWMWSFVPGVALAAIELGGGARRLRAGVGRRLPEALLATALLAVVAIAVADVHPGLSRSYVAVVLCTAAAGGAVAAPLALQWQGRPCWRALDNRLLRWVGVRSFSIYLVHLAVIDAVREPAIDLAGPRLGVVLILATALPLACLIGHFSYEWVERPFLRRKLPWRRPAQTADAPAAPARVPAAPA